MIYMNINYTIYSYKFPVMYQNNVFVGMKDYLSLLKIEHFSASNLYFSIEVP